MYSYLLSLLICVLVFGANFENVEEDEKINDNGLINRSERFTNTTAHGDNNLHQKDKNLLLFISITSGPVHTHLRHAIRNTWILPCKVSPLCDYRFFVDAPASRMTSSLVLESITHNDMVFRNSCSLMTERHSDLVHYGNTPPLGGFLTVTLKDPEDSTKEISVPNPDYKYRKFYKVDWKVCFLRWALAHSRMAEFHVFVEDDSFTCTENLLHQTAILRNISAQNEKISNGANKRVILPFRTGTRMFDGFDDSTTFMSREVALAFAHHYMEPGLNCSRILDNDDPAEQARVSWLSWGNSWISHYCGWRKELQQSHLNMTILFPDPYCLHAHVDTTDSNVLHFPCMTHSLTLHHHHAPDILLGETKPKSKVKHICEYMLLVDKVKDVRAQYALWNAATAHNYHDFSEVFLNDEAGGWRATLEKLAAEETLCRDDLRARHNKAGQQSGYSDNMTEIMLSQNISKECIFERDVRYRRNLGIQSLVFGPALYHNDNNRIEKSALERRYIDSLDDPGFAAYYSLRM